MKPVTGSQCELHQTSKSVYSKLGSPAEHLVNVTDAYNLNMFY